MWIRSQMVISLSNVSTESAQASARSRGLWRKREPVRPAASPVSKRGIELPLDLKCVTVFWQKLAPRVISLLFSHRKNLNAVLIEIFTCYEAPTPLFCSTSSVKIVCGVKYMLFTCCCHLDVGCRVSFHFRNTISFSFLANGFQLPFNFLFQRGYFFNSAVQMELVLMNVIDFKLNRLARFELNNMTRAVVQTAVIKYRYLPFVGLEQTFW